MFGHFSIRPFRGHVLGRFPPSFRHFRPPILAVAPTRFSPPKSDPKLGISTAGFRVFSGPKMAASGFLDFRGPMVRKSPGREDARGNAMCPPDQKIFPVVQVGRNYQVIKIAGDFNFRAPAGAQISHRQL